MAPENRPEVFRHLDQDEVYVEPGEVSRAMLLETFEEHIQNLNVTEEKPRTGPDAVSRKQMLDEASLLEDAALRRYNRCHSEGRITVDRAVKGLTSAIDRDNAAETETETEDETSVVATAPCSSRRSRVSRVYGCRESGESSARPYHG